MDFGEFVRTQGLPIAGLVVIVVTLWTTWRADTKEASEQRERNIEALGKLSDQIAANKTETAALTKSLSEFFLKHFP
jgi:hypothetical protein